MPRANRDMRVTRDAWVLRLFLAGYSYREIGRHPKVWLSPKGVSDVVHRALREANPKHNALGTQARVMYGERLEMMLRAVWPKAVAGDLRAVAVALRILAQEARFHALESGAADVDLLADARALERYRARRQ